MIWEPDGKFPPGHRLLESNRPQTTFFKYGHLTSKGETILLRKNRIFIWILVFILLTPVSVGLIIGLCFLIELLLGGVVEGHYGVKSLFATGVVIPVVVLLIPKVFKPIRRQFHRSQVANVQIRQVQSYHIFFPAGSKSRPVNEGWVGVEFSLMPPGSFLENAQGNGPLRVAIAEKCTFVTFIARGEAQAKSLREWLPATRVALMGIPPQQDGPFA